jgi:hypothetical protein
MVMKQCAHGRLGIGFRSRPGKLVISSIAEDGIFAHSLLNASDTCISINGVDCGGNLDATAAAAMIRASPSFIKIVTQTRHETGVVVATSAMAPTISSNTTPAVTYAAGVVESAPPAQLQPHENCSKVCCGVFFCFVFFFVIVTAVISANRRSEDYYGDCYYLTCNVCGFDCYSK